MIKPENCGGGGELRLLSCRSGYSRRFHEKFSSFRHGRREARFVEAAPRRPLPVLAALGLGALCLAGGDAFAAPVCSDTPGTGNHIDCVEESSSTDDIDINAKGIDIDFDESGTDSSPIAGVSAKHSGSGNVSINISGKTNADMTTTPSTIDTTGSNSYGVYGRLEGTGGLTFTLENTEIGTQGESAVGMNGLHTGNGHLVVDLKTGVTINTEGVHAYGISVQQANVTAGEMNDASLTTQGTSITTKGNHAHGIWARRGPENTLGPVGTGDVRIIFKDSTVATGGNEAHGIYGYRYGTGSGSGDGHVDIRSENSTITTNGAEAYGILGWRQDTGNGDVIINLNGGSTTTNRYLGHGIYGIHYRVGTGNIKITTTNHAIWDTSELHHSAAAHVSGGAGWDTSELHHSAPAHVPGGAGGNVPRLYHSTPASGVHGGIRPESGAL